MSKFDYRCVGDAVLLRALDQELAPRQAWLVKLHLDHCEPCRTRSEEMRRVTSEVEEFHQVPFPALDIQAFATRMELEAAREQRRVSPARWFTTPRKRWQRLAWCGGLAILILAATSLRIRRVCTPVPNIASAPRAVAPPVPKQLVAGTMPAKRARPAHRLARKQVPAAAVASKEVVTPFFPLPFSDAALPLDQASVIRVDVPRSALEWTGLPVEESRRNERIRADLVVGADGLARAIRFIR